MKSILFLMIIGMFSFFDSPVGKEKNDWAEYGLKGEVKVLKTVILIGGKSTDQNDSNRKVIYIYEKQFDRNGNLIEDGNYNPDKTLITKEVHKFDTNGKMIEVKFINNTPNALDSRETYKYDKDGKIIECDLFNAGGSLTDKIIYKNKKNETECSRIDIQGNLVNKEKTIYNEKGDKIEYYVYIPDGTLDSKETYTYNVDGALIESNKYSPEMTSHSKVTYSFDNSGNMVEQKYYMGYKDRELEIFNKYLFIYKSYDEKGNWIRSENYHNDTTFYISKREVEYYK